MVNALFDQYQQSTGSVAGSGVDVLGDLKSITTEQFELIDTSDNGVIMAISKVDGCDINTETTIQPTSDQSTALVVNNSNGVALAMISENTGLLTSKPIGMIVNNNTLLEGSHYLSGADLNVIGAAPTYANLSGRGFRSRVVIGTKAYNYALGAAIDTVPTGIMVSGGSAGLIGTQTTAAFGTISLTNPTLATGPLAIREIMRFQVALDNTTKMVGINIQEPTSALHVKNSTALQTALAVDSSTGTRLLSVDNSGNLTVAGNISGAITGLTGSQSFTNTSSSSKILTLKSSTGSDRLTVADDSSVVLTSAVANPGSVTLSAGTTSNNFVALSATMNMYGVNNGSENQVFLQAGHMYGTSLSGLKLGGGVYPASYTFTTWNTMYGGTQKENFRIRSLNGTGFFMGINNTSPTNTLDITNTISSTKILNCISAAGANVFSIDNNGHIDKSSLSPPSTGQIGSVTQFILGVDTSVGLSFPGYCSTGTLPVGTYSIQATVAITTSAMVQSLEFGVVNSNTANFDDYGGYMKPYINAAAGVTLYYGGPTRYIYNTIASAYYLYVKTDANVVLKAATKLTVVRIA